MNLRTRIAPSAAPLAASGLGLGACQSSGNGGYKDATVRNPAAADDDRIVGGTPVKGGTPTVLSYQDFDHPDPARNWTMPDAARGIRLPHRTPTAFKAEPGKAGGEIVPTGSR